MQINPILIKELKVRARTVKIPIYVMCYNAVLALIAIVMLTSSSNFLGTSGHTDYRIMNEVFAGMGIVQCVVVILASLVLSAGSFTSEREMGTMDMLLMTPVRTWEVVNGKFAATVLTSFFFAISSLPIIALGTVYGGTDIVDILYLQIVWLVLSSMAGGVGLLSSAINQKTSVSVLLALATEICLIVGPFIFLDFLSSFFYSSYQYGQANPLTLIAILLLSMNPVMLIIRFYDRIMGTTLLINMFHYSYGLEMESPWYSMVQEYYPELCMLVQLLLTLLISFFIMKMLKRRRNVN